MLLVCLSSFVIEYDPVGDVQSARTERNLGPELGHPLGTDFVGRDTPAVQPSFDHSQNESQQNALRAAALRVVAHMQQVALSGSFTWWSYWAKKNSQIAAMALRMQSVLTGRAFVSWLEAVETWQSERADEVSAAAASTS